MLDPQQSTPDQRVAVGQGAPTSLARWVALCAAAETVGMTTAASAAKAVQAITGDIPPSGPVAVVAMSLVVAGGLVEGAALGLAQTRGLRDGSPAHDGRAGFSSPSWLPVWVGRVRQFRQSSPAAAEPSPHCSW